jgi:hypothetical protein
MLLHLELLKAKTHLYMFSHGKPGLATEIFFRFETREIKAHTAYQPNYM